MRTVLCVSVTVALDLAVAGHQLDEDLELNTTPAVESEEPVAEVAIDLDPVRPRRVQRSTQQAEFSYD